MKSAEPKLKVSLPSDNEIVMTRSFDAPRYLVFEAFTKPEYIRRWYGPRNTTVPVCTAELRVGGAWRYVIRNEDGQEHAFKGEYLEFKAPEKIVYTFIYEGQPGDGGRVTDVFTEEGGRTHLHETMVFPSKVARDGVVASGMETGAAESMDRLEELVVEMRPARSS